MAAPDARFDAFLAAGAAAGVAICAVLMPSEVACVVSALVVKATEPATARPRAEIPSAAKPCDSQLRPSSRSTSAELARRDIRAGGCEATNCSPIPTYGVRTCAIQRGPIGIQQGEGCFDDASYVPKSSPTM